MKKKNLNWLLALLAALALVFAGACSDGSDDPGSNENENGNNNPSGGGGTEYCSDCATGTCTVTTGCTSTAGCQACADANCTCSDCAETQASYSVASKTATYTADNLGNCTAASATNEYALASVAIGFGNTAGAGGDGAMLTVTYYHCGTGTADHTDSSEVAWASHTLYTYEGTCSAYTDNSTDTVTVTLPASGITPTNSEDTLAFAYGSSGETLTLTGVTASSSPVASPSVTVVGSNNGADADGNPSGHAGEHGIDLFGASVTGALTASGSGTGFGLASNGG